MNPKKDHMAMPAQVYRTAARLESAAIPASLRDGAECRGTLRIAAPFPITVRGVDVSGERFGLQTVLDNLSATGLCLRLARPIATGAPMFVVVRLATAPCHAVAAPGVAARGVVVRVQQRSGQVWGVAMQFTRHRFLYSGQR
jgi:hypothetical protein